MDNPNNEEDGESAKNPWKNWLKAVLAVTTVIFLFRFFQGTGWLDKVSSGSSNLTLGVAFLVGFVASVSSCLAVVGGVVIAFSEKYQNGGKSFFESAVRPNLFFHTGRIVSFFVLGGLLGYIGGGINISGNFVFFYSIIIATVMGWLGLTILGIAPSISALGIQPPKIFRKYWYSLEESNRRSAPFVLGALTFFLPCGFTQSMQILALASGSFWIGAASLFMFSLGTAPVLLALGVGASWGKFKKIDIFKKAAGILILLFAVFTFKSALALKGVKTNVISSNSGTAEKDSSNNVFSQNEQVVRMSVTSRGFEPNILKIKKGVPVRWVIMGDQVSGCTNKIIVPSLDIAKNINSGENTISFMPSGAREIPFSCGMGMVRGKFILE